MVRCGLAATCMRLIHCGHCLPRACFEAKQTRDMPSLNLLLFYIREVIGFLSSEEAFIGEHTTMSRINVVIMK